MPRMSRRSLARRYRGGFRGPFGWDGRRVVGTARPGRTIALSGSRSLAGALSRVHTFKRVGTPCVITNLAAAPYAQVHPSSNFTMISGSGALAGSIDDFLASHSQQRGAFMFKLNQASAIGEITSLFDNYRIVKVKLNFMFSYDNSTGAGAAFGTPNLAAPVMHYCYDPDDNATPLSRVEVLQNGYCKTVRLTRQHTVTIVPRAQQPVVGGALGAGGVVPLGQWMDTASADIQFYGLKFWIDQFPRGAADSQYCLSVTPTFYIEAKNVV